MKHINMHSSTSYIHLGFGSINSNENLTPFIDHQEMSRRRKKTVLSTCIKASEVTKM